MANAQMSERVSEKAVTANPYAPAPITHDNLGNVKDFMDALAETVSDHADWVMIDSMEIRLLSQGANKTFLGRVVFEPGNADLLFIPSA